MDYPQKIKNESPRIPIPLRAFVYKLFSPPPATVMGQRCYEWVASRIASNFLEFPDVQNVFLIGGGLSRCVPAVSDLDFVVEVEPLYEKEFLKRFRVMLKRQRALFPVLGEVHLVAPGRIEKIAAGASASSFWFKSSQKFNSGTWKEQRPKQGSQPPLESKFALALFHFWKGIGYFRKTDSIYGSYYQRHFERELSKTTDYLQGGSLSVRKNMEPTQFIETAMRSLETVAQNIIVENKRIENWKLSIKDKGAERFAIEVKQRKWAEEFRHLRLGGLAMAGIPGVLVGNVQSSVISTFYRIFSGERDAPLLLGPTSCELIRRGLGWGGALQHLDWISPENLEDDSVLEHTISLTARAIWDRASLNSTLFRGKLVSASLEKIHGYFEEIYQCYWCLKKKILTNDLTGIRAEMRREFPNLPSKKQSPYLEALKEIEKFLNSFQPSLEFGERDPETR